MPDMPEHKFDGKYKFGGNEVEIKNDIVYNDGGKIVATVGADGVIHPYQSSGALKNLGKICPDGKIRHSDKGSIIVQVGYKL